MIRMVTVSLFSISNSATYPAEPNGITISRKKGLPGTALRQVKGNSCRKIQVERGWAGLTGLPRRRRLLAMTISGRRHRERSAAIQFNQGPAKPLATCDLRLATASQRLASRACRRLPDARCRLRRGSCRTGFRRCAAVRRWGFPGGAPCRRECRWTGFRAG